MLVEHLGLLLDVALEDLRWTTSLGPILTSLADDSARESRLVDRRDHAQHTPAEKLLVLMLVLIFDHLLGVCV